MGYLENRLNYLVKMFTFMYPNYDDEKAEKIILHTQAGKDIMDKNASYLYNTIQSNMFEILKELESVDEKFRPSANEIGKAYQNAFGIKRILSKIKK